MPNHTDVVREVLYLLERQQLSMVKPLLAHLNIADQARVLGQVSPKKQVMLLQQCAKPHLVFEFLALNQQVILAQHLARVDLVKILDDLHSDNLIDVYKRLPNDLQQQLIPLLSKTSQHELKTLGHYIEGTAGAMMSLDFVTLAADLTMDEAIAQLRQTAERSETLYLTYIVNTAQQLIGVISLREIIQADPQCRISEHMNSDVIYAYVDEDQEQVAKALAHYDFLALPIVDRQQHLLGIVTYDDAMDILEQESTEDIFKTSAVQVLSSQSIKQASIFQLYQSRVFWLVILVFGSLLSGIGIAYFEDIIAQNLVLVFFLPLLVGSGGNAGSQSATLMVRALATGDVTFSDWFHLLGREALIAFCLGLTMAIAVSVLGYLRGDWMVAVVLAISMMGIVMMGCLIGMSLPFILKHLKFDPASASAPLVTSICDATGVVFYLFIASILLF